MEKQHFEYRTGRTQPKKSSNGLIAGLLICIIFLCGVISAMGLMNIRLTWLLQDARQDAPPLSFAEGEAVLPMDDAYTDLAGMALVELPAVYQQLHGLPQGLYISQVDDASHAAMQGILPGDVLVRFDDAAAFTLTQLDTLKAACKPGSRVELLICRDGQDMRFCLTLP